MAKRELPSAAFADTKPHYEILDGLRGVAAIMVVCFHLFEAYATSHIDQQINIDKVGCNTIRGQKTILDSLE